MELYEMEREKAGEILAASGRSPDHFSFAVSYLPPDPDGAGMYTVRYEVTIANDRTARRLVTVGGIGLDWVGDFSEALSEGHFD